VSEAIDAFFEERPPEGPSEPVDGWNRYLLPDEDGIVRKGWTQPSTVANTLGVSYGLNKWSMERVAWGMAQRPDLLAKAAALAEADSDDSRRILKEVVDAALIVGKADEGANLGTALHSALQRVDQGESIDNIHPFFHADIRAYLEELAKHGIKMLPQYVERVVKNDLYRIGGKIDNIAQLHDGRYAIVDKKRKNDPKAHPHSIVTQLAPYVHADRLMNYETGQYEELPPLCKDFALIVWFEPGTGKCEILEADMVRGWWSVRLAMETREWRNAKHLLHPYISNGTAKNTTAPPVNHYSAESEAAQVSQQLVAAVAAGPVVPPSEPVAPQEVVPTAQKPSAPQGGLPPRIIEMINQPIGLVDPEAEKVEWIDELANLSKPELQQMCRDLGERDENKLKRHRKPLAEMIVGMVNARRGEQEAPVQQPVQAAPAPSQETSALTPEQQAMVDIAAAGSETDLVDIWNRWGIAYGPHTWPKALSEAATARMAQLVTSVDLPL
jgi:hypothetical protein